MTSSGQRATPVDLRCTVLDAATGREVHLDVEAAAGSTLGDLLRAVDAPVAPARVNGRAVRTSHPLGAPPLVHGCLVVLGDARTPPSAATSPAALCLEVVGGPDAGLSLPLVPGDHVVGRSAPAALRIADDELSRQHLVVNVAAEAVTIQDLRSTNGTWMQSSHPDEDAVRACGSSRLPVGGRLGVGRSTLELRTATTVPARTQSTGSGTILVHRPPRQRATTPTVGLTVPPMPGTTPSARVPWVAMAVPLVLCVGAAWLLHQATYLLFGLMSPLILALSAVADRVTGRRRRRQELQEWRLQTDELAVRARLTLLDERATLRRAVGDPCLLSRLASLPGGRLWERTRRDDDVLRLAVGTADIPSQRLSWTPEPLEAHDAPALPEAVLHDAPLTVDLVRDRHLGLGGHRDTALRLLRWLMGQVVVWHGPTVVRLAVVADDADEWRWARWLPHVVCLRDDPDEVADWVGDVVRRRKQLAQDAPWASERLIVVVDAARLASAAGVRDALSCVEDIGVHVVSLADNASSLPSECGALLSLTHDGCGRLSVMGHDTEFTVVGARSGWAEDLARNLSPLRDGTPAPGQLPSDVRLADLLPVDPVDSDAVAALWRAKGRSTRAVIGIGADGPLDIDLLADGPHILVAGTTGAGKSELLRTLVTSLAVTNRPDELAFVLVDYKGGSAFQGCAELVHTAGLVTDLDGGLAARALASLESELSSRERALRDAGCRDVAEYQARRDVNPRLPALPRLVIVVDEFRVLAMELPEFLEGVVRVAAVGRSLGVHVVLATQRPAGVVTADIKANMNLRICLRVRDRADSDDVLDAPDAAAIAPEAPGRALLRRGGDGLVGVQVARVDEVDRAPGTLRVREWNGEVGRTPVPSAPPDAGENALTRTVAACLAAAQSLGLPAPRPVWLPALPDRLTLDRLAEADRDVPAGSSAIGLLDLPHEQRQRAWCWHPHGDGHLAISGGARTGRTSALLTVAAGLVRRWPPYDLHLHVLTAGGTELSGLAALPHTGTMVSADEPHRVTRLLDRLAREVARRRRSTTPAGAPTTLLLIDGWEAVTERLAEVDHGRPVDDLLTLLRDGEPLGVRAVITGGRGVLLSRVAAVVGNRLLLRPHDPTDLLLAGVPPAAVPARQPAGRALRSGDGAQVQIAEPPDLVALAREVARLWPAVEVGIVGTGPLRLRALPERLHHTALTVAGRPDRWALVGQGEDGEALGLDLAEQRVAFVVGPPASGRSTLLATMALSLQSAGVPVLFIGAPPPMAGLPLPTVRPPEVTQDELRRAGIVVVDDVERILGTPLEAALTALLAEPGPSLVAAGTTVTFTSAFRGLAALGRTHRTGVLLRPGSPSDGEALGVRALLDDAASPGRGVVVERGRQRLVQVAVSASSRSENDRRSVSAGTYG